MGVQAADVDFSLEFCVAPWTEIFSSEVADLIFHEICTKHLQRGMYVGTDYGHPIRHKSKISEKLGRCGRQNKLRPYLKI